MPPRASSSRTSAARRKSSHQTGSDKKKRRRSQNESQDTTNETEEDYEVEKVLNKKIYKGKVYYQLKWVGHADPTWEEEEKCHCDQLIADYESKIERQSKDEDDNEWEVEKIIDKRTSRKNKVEYLVKWKNWQGDYQWIKEEDCSCVNLIAAFENPKLRKMWNFTGSNPHLWITQNDLIGYMKSYALKKKYRVNLLEFEEGFPDDELPLALRDGLNIGPLLYKDHWYLVIILKNFICVNEKLLVGDPLNTVCGSPHTRTHPVFKRLTMVYPRIPAKPFIMTPMDRSDVCGFYVLAAYERALFLYDTKASFIPEQILFDYTRAEAIRARLKPETNNEFSVALPVSSVYLGYPRCEFCNEHLEDRKSTDQHIKREHFT